MDDDARAALFMYRKRNAPKCGASKPKDLPHPAKDLGLSNGEIDGIRNKMKVWHEREMEKRNMLPLYGFFQAKWGNPRDNIAYDWNVYVDGGRKKIANGTSPAFASHVLYPAFEMGISRTARQKYIRYDSAWSNERSQL